ncbi:MAG: Mpv17/PMP22 family protein [Lentisphaeria bacterium]|nr:Mpv17/PMP22 family protein [Lentisphaeria bacterium]
MKKGDVGAIVFLVVFVCAVVFFPWTVSFSGEVHLGKLTEGLQNFGKFTSHFPYLMGFFKVGLLATFGEMLKVRVKTGSWKVPALFARFIVWGVVGLLFTLVFALFGKGISAMIGTPLWFGRITLKPNFGDNLLFAFSTSFWMNMIFAFPMMLGHEWCNEVINQKRFIGGAEFLEKLNKAVWGSFIPKTIVFFWIPAHTVTFLLPPDYRVLMSAVLSLVLGAILTFRSSK